MPIRAVGDGFDSTLVADLCGELPLSQDTPVNPSMGGSIAPSMALNGHHCPPRHPTPEELCQLKKVANISSLPAAPSQLWVMGSSAGGSSAELQTQWSLLD